MRHLYFPALSVFRFSLALAALTATFTAAKAQTPLPPKPDEPSNLQRAGELQDKPKYRPSEIKPVAPLFDPRDEVFTQGNPYYRKPTRLKIGAFFPASKTLRDATEPVFLTLGASLDLPPRGLTRKFTPEVYFDSAFSVEDDDNQATLLGLGIGFRSYPGARPGFKVVSPRFFYGLGVGAYYLRKEVNDTTDDAFQLGGKASLGFDVADDWTIEANYTLTGKVTGTNFGGPSVAFAYRF